MLLKKGNVSLGQNKEALSPRAKFSRSTLIFMTNFCYFGIPSLFDRWNLSQYLAIFPASGALRFRRS